MATTIFVTGSTGTIGSNVVAALAPLGGITTRAGVRSAAKAEGMRRGNVTPVDFDYAKPDTLRAALDGVDRVFLLTPFSSDQVELGRRVVDAAKAAGVKHVVKLSAIGCENEPGIQLGRWHRELERHVEASGMAWTFLRPNNFMQNFINFYPPGPDGCIYLPWGTSAVSIIDARDVGDVAAAVLTKEGHEGKAYDLTGPEAITVAQAAAAISEVSGRDVRYVDVPEEAARAAMQGMQMPPWMVDAMMELHAIDKAGYAAGVSPAAEQILGRKPRSFAEFAQENAAAWKSA